jgi:hypothetical protein
VLLPVLLLVRRADTAAVIGEGLAAKAAGGGHRVWAALFFPDTYLIAMSCCGLPV